MLLLFWKAKVSISTVSLAFNNPERVSEATRKKIYQATKELKYVPASVAKKNAFKERKRKSVAVIIGSLVGPFWFEILRGINEILSINKIEMVLFSGNDSFEKHFLDLMRGDSCQGIVLITEGDGNEQLLQIAVNENFPVVMCCPPMEYTGLSCIMVDNWNIGQLAANYFMQLGRNDIAIFGKIEALQEEGIKVPEQISVIGCDNISISRFIHPPLTTIEMPKFEVGILAVNRLLRRMSGMH